MARATANSRGSKTTAATGKKSVAKALTPRAKKTVAKKTAAKSLKRSTTKSAPKTRKVVATGPKVTTKISSTPKAKKAAKTKRSPKTAKTYDNKLLKRRTSKTEAAFKDVALEQLFKRSESEPTSKETKSGEQGSAITLPKQLSLRALEKAEMIHRLTAPGSEHYVRRLTIFFAALFILVGASVSLSNSALVGVAGSQSASLLSQANSNTQQTLLSVQPTFSVSGQLPAELTGEHQLRFSLTNTALERVYAENVATGERAQLDAEQNGTEYRITLVPSNFGPGDYRVQVRAYAQTIDRSDLFTLGTFSVPNSSTALLTSPTVANLPATTAPADDDLVGTTTNNTQASIQNTADDTLIATVPDSEIEDEEDSTEPTPQPQAELTRSFSFALSATTFTKSSVVLTTAPADLDSLELYLTPERSPTRRFLTSAEFVFNRWRFYLGVENIPNGRYELVAVGTRDGITLESKPVLVTVDKPVRVPVASNTEPVITTQASTAPVEPGTTPDETEATAEENEASSVATPAPQPTPSREFSELSLTPDPTDPQSEASQIVTELLRARKNNLEILLRNYSAASQGNDPTAVTLARQALVAEQEAVLSETGPVTDAIAGELDRRLNRLVEKIDTFEELRRGTTESAATFDTDRDGISDLDEEVLFRTNPTEADSDGDGITDAVEIMRGFNPTDATPEAIIVHESPRETIGLVRADVLQVETVAPEVRSGVEIEPVVYATIAGRGLPNSYVTLYIFSTPTIVTVRTDDTGQFSYTFEKELPDGEHEVYVAITDNTGEIVAQSAPFRFVKEAQAFTVGSVTEQGETPLAVETGTAQIVLGMGILAFGIILLLLGFGLKPRPTVIAEPAT